MKGFDFQKRKWHRFLRARFGEWEGSLSPDTEEAYFNGWESMPDPNLTTEEFDPVLAWWLAELCRLAYTPDHVEIKRDKKGRLPDRTQILLERSPFEEVHSVHKSGNHASIYRLRDGGPGAIVCFRGSSKLRQWIMNSLTRPHGWRRFQREGVPAGGFVHSGFYVLLKRVWPLVLPELESCPRPWIFTGHSLGGALASLASLVTEPNLVCTFGAPKIGNEPLHDLVNETRLWRLVNDVDLVPRLPLPDPKWKAKMFIHGGPPRVFDREGAWLDEYDRGEEDRLPFSTSSLHREFTRPPYWLIGHRMNEYCQKLRARVVAELDSDEGNSTSNVN